MHWFCLPARVYQLVIEPAYKFIGGIIGEVAERLNALVLKTSKGS